jgi:hypothetical protein
MFSHNGLSFINSYITFGLPIGRTTFEFILRTVSELFTMYWASTDRGTAQHFSLFFDNKKETVEMAPGKQ